MSTRASILITDGDSTLHFYRHSDGYPECCGKDLKEFIEGYKCQVMRNSVSQSAGWLIVRGHKEYLADGVNFTGKPTLERYSGWKVGAYEPTDEIHGDVEYIYIIDLKKFTLTTRVPIEGFWDNADLAHTKILGKAVSFKPEGAE